MVLTWLHVSDVHLSASNPHERDVVIPALFEFVKTSRERGELKPDFIFATGDIAERGSVAAFMGKGSEPALATAFFDDLLQATALEKDRLFIVPGNHDVEQRMGNGLVRTLMNQDASDLYFDPKSPMYHLSGKLGAFASWYNDYFSTVTPQRVFPNKSTCQLIPYTLTNEGKDLQLKLLLLNSTLFCEDSQTDHGKLWIGLRNLDPLIKQLQQEKHDLAIALVHHPLEWFANDSELTQIPTLLKSAVDILMRGHNHKPVAELRDNLIEIAAGATFLSGEQKDKRALYGRFNGTTVEVFPVCYQKNSSPKVWTVDTALFSKNEEGTYTKTVTLPARLDTGKKYPLIKMSAPKAFIVYFLEDDNHKKWVADLATRLRHNGVETILDQWHAVPGD